MTQYKDKVQLTTEQKKDIIRQIGSAVEGAIKDNVSLPDTPIKTVNRYFRDVTREYEKSLAASSSLGLLNYPVLMASDILLYGAEYVPVGDDQTQHLEFTRDIAERMNSKFGELFGVPKPVEEQHKFFGKDQGLRIRDLQNPTKKMSKSDETGRGIVFLSDEPTTASKKVMSAETDSLESINYDYEKQPGVSNLLEIYQLLGGDKNDFIGQSQYGPLKQAVASYVEAFLSNFQSKLAQVDEVKLLNKLEKDEAKMNEIANTKLRKVQKAVGLR